MGGKCEFSLVTLTAVMHHYMDNRWIIVGPSRIGIYHDTEANSFRIVARKIDEHEVVANCAINETFSYDQSTPSFHQWRDSSKVFGVKFGSIEEGTLFAETIRRIVLAFDQVHKMIESTNAAMELSNGGQMADKWNSQTSANMAPTKGLVQGSVTPSAIVASVPIQDPVATYPSGRCLKPVPPPPPPPQNGNKSSNLSTAANNNNKNFERGTQPKPGPSFLNEMELTLARRRAKIDALDEADRPITDEKVTKDTNTNQSLMNGSERKWSLPVPNSNHLTQLNGDQANSFALDKLKEEILCDVREELMHFKKDLIEAIKEQLGAHRH